MSVAAVIVARGKHKKELEKTNMQAVDDALEAAKVFDAAVIKQHGQSATARRRGPWTAIRLAIC